HCRASSGVIMNFWLICGNAPAWAAAAGLAWAPSDVRLKTAPAATPAAVFRKVRREEPVVLFRDLLIEPSSLSVRIIEMAGFRMVILRVSTACRLRASER